MERKRFSQVKTIAIIGAGCAGLAAAHTLRDAGHRVRLFEKDPEVGGRAATRTRDGFIYDHGAQYIKQGSPASVTLITERFHTPGLIDIAKPVWIFDGTGHIQEGDPQQNAEPKWSYRYGLGTLPELMVQGLDIQLASPITRLEQTAQSWQIASASGPITDRFDAVLITLPASQATELIAASHLSTLALSSIIGELKAARYNPLISVMLGYRPQPTVRPYYALVNTDKAHPISWLAWEHEKAAERVPPGTGLLLAQMAPQYSQDHWQDADTALVQEVAHLVANLIAEPLPAPIFSDIQRWQYALPASRADAQALNTFTLPHGLAFCGDAYVGGRVHLAIEHAIMVAEQLSKIDTSDNA